MLGNQTIFLAKDFLPNVDNSVHFRFTNVNDYINYIGTNYGISEAIHADNYRLNANKLKISFDYFKRNNLDYRKVTYVYLEQVLGNIYEGGQVLHTFYYVKNAILQSDYVIFTIEVDYWATYQFLLDNGKIQLNRTNAVLANETMVYDDIVKAETPFQIDPVNYSYRLSGTGDERRYLPNSFFYVVFIVEYVTIRNLANTDYVKATALFACTLSHLVASIGSDGNSYASVDIASMVISGITSTTTNIGGVNNDAKVISAYIVPSFETNIDSHLSAVSVEFNYRTMATGSTTKQFTAYHLKTYRRDVPYYEFLAPTLSDYNNQKSMNYKYYVGSFHNYMQLVNYRKTGGVQFMVSFVFSPSKVQLIVSQGDNSKDITNAITIPQIANVEISDALQTMCYIADGLGMALNNAKSIMNSKSYGELALNVGDALLDNFKFFKGNVNADMGVTQGDGLTELRKDHDNCMHPLNIIYFKSLNDEAYNARIIGANVNATINNIDVLDGANLLGNTPQDVTFDNYYVRGNLVTTAIGQKDAFDIIASKLRNGIHLKFIHDIS